MISDSSQRLRTEIHKKERYISNSNTTLQSPREVYVNYILWELSVKVLQSGSVWNHK